MENGIHKSRGARAAELQAEFLQLPLLFCWFILWMHGEFLKLFDPSGKQWRRNQNNGAERAQPLKSYGSFWSGMAPREWNNSLSGHSEHVEHWDDEFPLKRGRREVLCCLRAGITLPRGMK